MVIIRIFVVCRLEILTPNALLKNNHGHQVSRLVLFSWLLYLTGAAYYSTHKQPEEREDNNDFARGTKQPEEDKGEDGKYTLELAHLLPPFNTSLS